MGKPLWQREKFQHVEFWVITSIIGSLIALKYGIPAELIGDYWKGSGTAIAGVMVAFGLSDAAHAGKE